MCNILGQTLNGLKALHDARIVHGNLKLNNILLFTLGDETTVKLTDYEGFPGGSADHITNNVSPDSRLI